MGELIKPVINGCGRRLVWRGNNWFSLVQCISVVQCREVEAFVSHKQSARGCLVLAYYIWVSLKTNNEKPGNFFLLLKKNFHEKYHTQPLLFLLAECQIGNVVTGLYCPCLKNHEYMILNTRCPKILYSSKLSSALANHALSLNIKVAIYFISKFPDLLGVPKKSVLQSNCLQNGIFCGTTCSFISIRQE